MWTHPRLTYFESSPSNALPTYSKHGEWYNPDKEKPSNLDTVLVTSSFAKTLCDSNVHRDLRLSTHCAVSCSFATKAFNTTFNAWTPAKVIPVEKNVRYDNDTLNNLATHAWKTYGIAFNEAILNDDINEAMLVWNKMAVWYLAKLIPGCNPDDHPRGTPPVITAKALFTADPDCLDNSTKWFQNIVRIINLASEITPKSALENNDLELDEVSYQLIQQLLVDNGIPKWERYPNTPSDIRHFIIFITNKKKYKIAVS